MIYLENIRDNFYCQSIIIKELIRLIIQLFVDKFCKRIKDLTNSWNFLENQEKLS